MQNFKVKSGIIHRIEKAQHTSGDQAKLFLQTKLHSVNAHLNDYVIFAENVLIKSGRNSSISGGFGVQHTLSKVLSDHYFNSTTRDFLILSKKIAQGLIEFVRSEPATTGEHLPMILYEVGNTKFLLISLISLSPYMAIDNNSGEFTNTKALDNSALKVGIKVNLDEMQKHYSQPNDDSDSYIQWVQRSTNKLPHYIQNFIPVSEQIDNTKATTSLITHLLEYLEKTFDDKEERNQVESDVFKLMRSKYNNDESIHIEDHIDPLLDSALLTYNLKNKATFGEYRQAEKLTLNSSFRVDKLRLDNYEKFNISLSRSGITIKGKKSELGTNVKALEDHDDGSKYLRIGMSDEEYEKFKTEHGV